MTMASSLLTRMDQSRGEESPDKVDHTHDEQSPDKMDHSYDEESPDKVDHPQLVTSLCTEPHKGTEREGNNKAAQEMKRKTLRQLSRGAKQGRMAMAWGLEMKKTRGKQDFLRRRADDGFLTGDRR